MNVLSTRCKTGEPLRQNRAGFTLTEIMTAMAIFSLVVAAMVYTHLFGIRMFNLTATKLSASHNARAALNNVRDEIRSGKMIYVGNGNSSGFTNIPINKKQEGNALQIYPTVNTNYFIRYFIDTNDQKLKRKTSFSSQNQVIASYVTNNLIFSAEDFKGNTLTNEQNNRVVKMSLDFYQWEFPSAQIAVGSYYDYYHLQTKITRRMIE